MEAYKARWQRARRAMEKASIEGLLLSPSSDMVYMSGFGFRTSERITLFMLLDDDRPTILMPAFERPKLGEGLEAEVSVIPWEEVEDPFAKLVPLLQGRKIVAVADEIWGRFLLELQRIAPGVKFVPSSLVLSPLRMVKDEREQEYLRIAQAKAEGVLQDLLKMPLAGRTELEVAAEITKLRVEHGLVPPHPALVCSGPNGASPHHSSGERIIVEGDAIVIDYGGMYRGYRADFTRTIHVGEPSEEFLRAYNVVQEANQKAFEAIRPGMTCEAIDWVARDHIEAAGYGEYFIHRLGHGIGLDGHEDPYLVEGNRLPLEAGMTVTVEPGVYIPGKFGIRIEDVVLVTEDGAERFNQFAHDLQIVQ